MSLNFPYFIYPGYPFSGYFDTDEYNKNIKNVLTLFKELNLSINKKILLHLTIGACMEEYLNICKTDEINMYAFQWEQLFPYHLREHAKNGGKVINIIISPTNSFNENNWINPTFVKNTLEFDWEINQNCIKSQKYDVTIFICYSMMPSVDELNCQKYELLLNKFETYAPLIIQTTNDIVFVNEFYEELQNLVNKIITYGGIFTCYSFAVFENKTKKSKFNNFAMFKEIKNMFNNNSSNLFLGEWIYMNDSHTVIQYNGKNNNITNINFITYTEMNDNEIARLAVHEINNTLCLIKEFQN